MINVQMLTKKPILAILCVVGVLILAAAPSYYFFTKYQKSQMLLKNPTEAAKQEVQALIARVGKLMELPNEEPTVATISDKEKLKSQPFFAKSENGDKVLIYTQDRKAILYRPSTNKIIEVSVVNLGATTAENTPATPSAQVAKPVLLQVAIMNGTNIVGLTSKAETQIKAKIPNLDVVSKENAKKRDYEKTVVIVLTQSKMPEGRVIAELLGAQIVPLPAGEQKPQADILIILGSDYKK